MSDARRPNYGQPADEERLQATARALAAGNVATDIVDTPEQARELVLRQIPEGASVLTVTSQTLEACGLVAPIETSGRYRPVRPAYLALDRATQADEIRRMRSTPDVVLGSVHAVTEDGALVVASQSGSQLAPYAFGAGQVIWVVGAQKVVADLDEAMRRIAEHAYPLEDARARQAYGTGSAINKVLIVNREARPGRARLVFVRQPIGF